MGFWKDLWNDDKPCFVIRKWSDEPKQQQVVQELMEENKRLRLVIKKMLEQGITEKKSIDVDHKLLE